MKNHAIENCTILTLPKKITAGFYTVYTVTIKQKGDRFFHLYLEKLNYLFCKESECFRAKGTASER